MNDDTPTPDELDDIAVYALDAHEPDEETAIESYLLTSDAAARWERDLREAAGELGARDGGDIAPPPGLRDRVLGAAFAARRPGVQHQVGYAAVAAALPSPVEVERIELQRSLRFLRSLQAEDWTAEVDPPEFAGWTVHDVAVHLAANATLLADALAVPVPGVPETERDNALRTAATRSRHRTLPPSTALDEIDAAARAVDEAVAGFDGRGPEHIGLTEEVEWWGTPTPIGWALMVRAFETWTHTDDIRRALGRPMDPPPPASLRAMSRAACGLVPLMLAATGEDGSGRSLRVHFTDVTDTAWDVELGTIGVARPAGTAPVDAELTVDAVDLCRAVGRRIPVSGLAYESSGDTALVSAVVDSLPSLAVL